MPALDLVGITGTNGKTTSTYLLDSIFRAAGKTTGVIGTVGTSIADERLAATHTTPESLDLQSLFADMRAAGVGAVSMEVSSHAIDLHRVDACDFAAVAFTNLTQDHLDYHHTLEEYFSVKTPAVHGVRGGRASGERGRRDSGRAMAEELRCRMDRGTEQRRARPLAQRGARRRRVDTSSSTRLPAAS